MRQSVKISQAPEEPVVEKEVLATSIVRIAEGFQKLLKTGLNRRALLVLIQDATLVSKRDIGLVLDAIQDLKSNYTK